MPPQGIAIYAAQVQLSSHATIVNCESHQGSVAHGKARLVCSQGMSDVSFVFLILQARTMAYKLSCNYESTEENTNFDRMLC